MGDRGRYCPSVQRTAFNDGWRYRPRVSLFAEMAGGGGEWLPVTLPHDAQLASARTPAAPPANAYFPAGAWEYRRELEIVEDEPGVVELEFEGVYRDASVFVNGSRAGGNAYGYSGFTVSIGHLLRTGSNELHVEARAGDDSRWYSGGGIYRDVWLRRSGPIHLTSNGPTVMTPEVDDDGAVLTVTSIVRNATHRTAVGTLRIEVADHDGEIVVSEDAPVTVFPNAEIAVHRRIFLAAPRRWRLEDPYLYVCCVTLEADGKTLDEAATTFGVRTLSLDPQRGLRINDESIVLRGACVHHDNGPIGAATIRRADERRVQLLKAAGFNAIRSAHNPMSTAMLDACDRFGMVVMDETYDMWDVAKSDHDHALRVRDTWHRDVDAMVRKDVNHPCVVFYSIGNEIPEAAVPSAHELGRAMADRIRSLDPSRFVTNALNGLLLGGAEMFADLGDAASSAEVDETTGVNTAITALFDLMTRAMCSPVVTQRLAEAASYLDVAGYNYMEARYELDAQVAPHRVIIASETHPATIDSGWAGVKAHPQVIGDFTWTGWDYLGEVGIGRVEYGEADATAGGPTFTAPYPWLTASCGDLDITGHRRPQSYYREIVYGLRTDPYAAVLRPEHRGKVTTHGTPWSWSDVVPSWSWPGCEGTAMTVEVYADAEEVELIVNGASLGRRPVGAAHRYRTTFDVEYSPGELVAVALRDGLEVGRFELTSASGAPRLRIDVDRPTILADQTDLAYVTIDIVDEGGRPIHLADREVAIELAGAGVLQGLASGRPATEEAFTSSSCATFDGRALAVIRPTRAGDILVTVTAEGCEPQRATITARPG